MGRIWMPGGGGGVDLDAITATFEDVLKGKVIVGPDGEPLTGVLELTGNAADSQVLSGKTYYNTDAKTKRTGTMPNQGAVAPSGLNAGGSYTIPAGYHNGSGKVSANSLASQTDATAAAGDILSGKTGWVKGSKVTGTMANQGAKTASLNCGGAYTIPAGYHNGSGKVTANALSGQTDATAGAGDIRKGKTAWVKGNKVTGTMTEKAAATITPGTSNQNIAANQYLTGAQTIKGDANLVAANIISGKSIFGVAGNARKYVTKSITVTSGGSSANFTSYESLTRKFPPLVVTNLGFTPLFVCYQRYSEPTTEMLCNQSNDTLKFIVSAWNSSPVHILMFYLKDLTFNSSSVILPAYRYNTSYTIYFFGYY